MLTKACLPQVGSCCHRDVERYQSLIRISGCKARNARDIKEWPPAIQRPCDPGVDVLPLPNSARAVRRSGAMIRQRGLGNAESLLGALIVIPRPPLSEMSESCLASLAISASYRTNFAAHARSVDCSLRQTKGSWRRCGRAKKTVNVFLKNVPGRCCSYVGWRYPWQE